MYELHRILDDNFVASDMLTVSSQGGGIVSGTQKDGTGSAVLQAAGTFTGTSDLLYTYQIDGAGEVGVATYRWRTNETAVGGWEATGVTTSTAYATLSNGVQVRSQSGSGVDCVLFDSWTLRGKASWSPQYLLDYDRGTAFRTSEYEDPTTITIDLNEAKNVTVFALYDHNINQYYDLVDVDGFLLIDVDSDDLKVGPSTITLKGNSSDSWGAPAYSTVLTIEDPLVLYLDETYRYWRIEIDEAGSNDFFIEIGALYLGSYWELECNSDWGTPDEFISITQGDPSPYGVLYQESYAEQRVISLTFPLLNPTEAERWISFTKQVKNVNTGIVIPFFFHLFNDENDSFMLMHLMSSIPRNYFRYNLDSISVTLQEVVQGTF